MTNVERLRLNGSSFVIKGHVVSHAVHVHTNVLVSRTCWFVQCSRNEMWCQNVECNNWCAQLLELTSLHCYRCGNLKWCSCKCTSHYANAKQTGNDVNGSMCIAYPSVDPFHSVIAAHMHSWQGCLLIAWQQCTLKEHKWKACAS